MSLHQIPGTPVVLGANPAEYHTLGADIERGNPAKVMSRSALKEFAECPAKWIQGEEREATKAMEWGDLMDARVTTPGLLDRFAVAAATYPAPASAKKDAPMIEKPWNMNATYCKEWWAQQEADGKTPVSAKDWSQSLTASAALDRDAIANRFLASCERQVQVMVEWRDVPTGLVVPVKCLLDLVPAKSRYLADFKTTASAKPRLWRKRVFDDQLHVQAALYMDAFNVATGEKRDCFRHIIQESVRPYMTARRMLSEEFIKLGRETYRAQFEFYCRCLASNTWPDFDTEESLDGPIFDGFRLVEPDPYMIAA